MTRDSKVRYLSGNPMTKREASRWIRIGIELTVIDAATDRPIQQQEGLISIVGPNWTGLAILHDGIVIKLQ